MNEEIAGKSWYYGQISRGDCDTLMAERGQDGDFLVRDSESNVSIGSFAEPGGRIPSRFESPAPAPA